MDREAMIDATCHHLVHEGFIRIQTRAGLAGYPETVKVNGFAPDIRARTWTDDQVILVAEDADSIDTDESAARWKALGRGYLAFEVILPGAILEEARSLAKRRDVRVQRYWVFEPE